MPVTPSAYQPLPFVRSGRLADLALRRGEMEADATRRRGEMSAQMWSHLGDSIAGTIGGILKNRQEAPARADAARMRGLQMREAELGVQNAERDAAAPARLARQDEAFLSLLSQSENANVDPRAVISIYGPQRGMEIAKGLHAFGELQTKQVADARDNAGRLAAGVKAFSPEVQARLWPAVRQAAITGGLGDESTIPETPDPSFLDGVMAWASGKEPPTRQKIERRNADGSTTIEFVDPQTAGPMTSAPEPKRHMVTVPGPNGQPVQRLATEDELTQGVAAYRAPVQPPVPSFQQKDVLDDAGLPVLANYDARTGRTTDASTGKPIANPRPVPSDAASQDARKFKQADPILSAVSELSEKINTQAGLIATMRGTVEKAKAQVNYNDDVAEYEALISGFTPLVARALGHTGVLTQQDVDSVKALFPRPKDSKSLRDRKVARIKNIIGTLEAGSNPKGGTTPPPADDADFDFVPGKGLVPRAK